MVVIVGLLSYRKGDPFQRQLNSLCCYPFSWMDRKYGLCLVCNVIFD